MNRFLLPILFGLLFVFVSACSDKPMPLFKVGVNQWPGYELLFLAHNLGYYDMKKSNIKLVELPSNTESLYLLREGRLDAAALTLDEALVAIDMGTAISIVLIFDFSNGADVLLAKPNIKTLKNLQHQRIGVESGGVGELLLYAALNHAKLEKEDVQVVYLTADEHLKAYMDDKVDALVTFEPLKTKLIKQGAHVLFDSSAASNLIIDVLAVRTDQIEKHKNNIQALIQGYYKARLYMDSQYNDAMKKMAPRLGMTAEDLRLAYEALILPSILESKAYFSGSPSPLERSMTHIATFMKKEGMLTKDINALGLQDASFVDALTP